MKKRKIILEQENDTIEVDAEEYLYLLKILGYDSELLADTPPYTDKKIIINGNLNVKGTPITSLHNIVLIRGILDISNTEIGDVSGIEVTKYIIDYGSKRHRIKERQIKNEKLQENQERRETEAWDMDNPEIDEEGIMANLVLQYFKRENPEARIKSEDDDQRLIELSEKLEQLLLKQNEYEENGKDITRIAFKIEKIEDSISEINDSIDVYDFNPIGSHYELTAFELVTENDYNDWQFAIGNENDADESLKNSFEEFIDNPQDYFTRDRLEDFVDEDSILDVLREIFSQDVYDSPEAYFDENDYELSEDDQERLEELENELQEYEERLEMEPDDTPEYEQLQNHIESLQEQIDELNESKEVTDKMKDDKIEDLMSDAENNVMSYAKDYGIELQNYINSDRLLESLVSESDYGHLNGWDNSYDEIRYNNTTYIVMCINKG